MSELHNSAPENSEAPENAGNTASPASTDSPVMTAKQAKKAAKKKARQEKKKAKGGFLWRWTKRLAVTAVVARLLLWVFLEHLADFGAGFAGLSVSWRSSSLSVCGLSLHIEDMVVRDAEDPDGDPLLTAQELVADLSMAKLLTGQVSVVDAGIAGARVTVHREANGDLRLPKAWLEPAAVTLPEPDPEEEPDDSPLSFELPCWIASTRLHDLQFNFIDHANEPAVHHSGKLDLDIADLGFPDRNGSVLLRVHAPQLCDELFVHTQVQAAEKNATVTFQAAVRGFRPHSFDLPEDVYGAIENAHVVDVRMAGNLDATVLAEAPKQPALAGKLDIGISLDGIERSTVTSEFGPTKLTETSVGGAATGVATPFALRLHTDGIVDSLQLQEGLLELSDGRTAVTAKLLAERITCTRIRPMLEAAGLLLPESGLEVSAALDAEFGEAMSIDLARLSIKSGEGEMLALPRVALRDLRTIDGTLAIDAIEVIGPVLPIRREADGSLAFAGLRTVAVAATAPVDEQAAPTAPAAPSQPTTPSTSNTALPKIRLGSFEWSGAELQFTDAMVQPEAATLAVKDLRLRADALVLGEQAEPGRIVLSFGLPGVAERTTADIKLASRQDGLTTDLNWQTSNVTLSALKPWLEPMGIASELTDGELRLTLQADVTLAEDGTHCDAQLANVQFADGGNKLLSLRSVRGSGIHVAPEGMHLGTWAIQDPFVQVQKDSEEILHALGLKLGPPPATAARSNTSAASGAGQPSIRRSASGMLAEQTTDDEAQQTQTPAGPPLRHGELRLDRTTLAYRDARFPDRVFQIGLDAALGANDGTGQALPIKATVRLDRAVKSCTVDASLQLDDERTSVRGKLDANGIEGRELQMLMPNGIACSLVNGSLAAEFDAIISTVGSKTGIDAKLRGVRVLDRDTEVAAIDEIVFDVPSLTDKEVHIRDAHVHGIRAIVTQTEQALHVPGFAIAAASATPAPPAAKQPAAAPAEANENAAQPDDPPATEPMTLPRLRLDALSVQLERFEFRDRSSGDAAPLVVQTELKLREPWFGDPASDEPTPLQLQVLGKVAPLGANLQVDATIALFDLTPTLDVALRLDSIDTTQLAKVMPSLADQLRGEATSLSAKADLHALLELKRRDASQFDLGRAFGAEFVIENIEVRDANEDEPYLSIAGIDAIVRAIDPRDGTVLIRSLTIDEPKLRAHQDEHGTHVAGFVLPPQPESPADAAPTSSDATAADEQTAPKATTSAPSDATAAGEFAIDRCNLLGLSVNYRDATTEPPTHLNLTDTDFELRRFTTRAASEPRPMSFTAAVRGGNVPLERRVVKSSVIAGFVASGTDALIGGSDQHEMVERPMLDQFTVDGQLQLFPTTTGRIDLDMQRLELAAFRGMAKQAGVDLADGLYDMRTTVDLKGREGIDIRSLNVLTYLVLDEPPNGPISTYLRLPAPLQSVLFLLRNEADEQRLPISMHVPVAGVSSGAIASLAIETLGGLIADAVSSAGSRVAQTATGGLLGGKSAVPDVTANLSFAAGSPLPDTDKAGAGLIRVIEALNADPTLSVVLTHEMGLHDQQHARELANPAEDVIQPTIDRLQARRAELEALRRPLARDVVALYAAGKSHEAWLSQGELKQIDTELGELLQTLASALDQLTSNHERNMRRRTRTCAVELAEARLDAVTAQIMRACPVLARDPSARIDRRPGRGVPIDGLTAGGRIGATLRRRSAQDLPSKRKARKKGQKPRSLTDDFPAVPPLADPNNRSFNGR